MKSKIELLKDWTPQQFKIVEDAILKYFQRTYLATLHNVPLYSVKTFKDLDNCLGLAFTSTSLFAMYSICNTQVYFDYDKKWDFNCFGLASNSFVYALLYDENENEIFFPIN